MGRALHESGARVLSWSATLDPALLCVIDEIPDLVAKSGLSLTTRGRDATIRTRSGRCRPSMTTGRFGAWRAGCVRPVGLAWSERHGVRDVVAHVSVIPEIGELLKMPVDELLRIHRESLGL